MSSRPRNRFTRYFGQIWLGIATTYVGMRLTLRHLWREPVTMLYPEVRPVIPPGHRGLHGYDEKKCVACMGCVAACPVACIKIAHLGKGKNVLITDYEIDYSRCLFCNLCAEACPADCLWLSETYDLSTGTREECVRRFARPKTAGKIEAFREKLAQQESERKARTGTKREA